MKVVLLLLAGLALAQAATMPQAAVCEDEADQNCWSRPDENCFGIYEPWSRKHCPSRCGYCPGGVPCEDKIAECAQFESYTCTQENYKIWARTNCRKHCNLCHKPTPPAGGAAQTTGMTAAGTPETPTMAAPAATTTGSASTGGLQGAVASGVQKTFIIQGPAANTTGMCLYQGKEYAVAARWNVGCDYECSCLDATNNHVVCTEKCTRWALTNALSGCKLTKEDDECCARLQCM